MTVKELRESLDALPDDIVVFFNDSEEGAMEVAGTLLQAGMVRLKVENGAVLSRGPWGDLEVVERDIVGVQLL